MEWIRYRYRLSEPRGFQFVTDNVERLVGYTPQQHYDDPDLGMKLVHPEFRHRLEEMLGGNARSGPLTIPWLHKDGRIVWTEQLNRVIRQGADGEVLIEGMAREIPGPFPL